MKITQVDVRELAFSAGDGGDEKAEFIGHIDLTLKHGDEPIGLMIKLAADVPYDPSLTFDEIAKRSVIRAREMLALASSLDEEGWLSLYEDGRKPKKRWGSE